MNRSTNSLTAAREVGIVFSDAHHRLVLAALRAGRADGHDAAGRVVDHVPAGAMTFTMGRATTRPITRPRTG